MSEANVTLKPKRLVVSVETHMSEANVTLKPKRLVVSVETHMSEANVTLKPKRLLVSVETHMSGANVTSKLHIQRVSEHATQQSGRAVIFSTNCQGLLSHLQSMRRWPLWTNGNVAAKFRLHECASAAAFTCRTPKYTRLLPYCPGGVPYCGKARVTPPEGT